MGKLQRESMANMRQATREYIRARVTGKRREIERETEEEIRATLRDHDERRGWFAAECAS